MLQKKIIVIGGGAAGLMAAGQAASRGSDVLVLEKMKQPGRKLCITGKGRCNITNIIELHDFIDHFDKTGRFLHQAFSHFFSKELLEFFKELGLETITERGGRVFPAQGNAHDVLAVMLKWLQQNNVTIKTSTAVEKLVVMDRTITGVISNGKTYNCAAAILTTGGASYPATGSSGDGYTLARTIGHHVVSIRPALVPLITKEADILNVTGLNLKNIGVRVYINGKKKKQSFGEISFTDFGLSGPVILTLSGYIVDALQKNNKVTISIDLKPALDEQKLDARLIREFSSRNKESFSSVLRSLLPRELIPVCIQFTKIPEDKTAHQISAKERIRLRSWLKDFPLEITDYRSFREAIITAGGIDTHEVNPNTMESKLIKGLFLAGEVLDIHADTGGYNLQAAFSTGWLAGRSAANYPE